MLSQRLDLIDQLTNLFSQPPMVRFLGKLRRENRPLPVAKVRPPDSPPAAYTTADLPTTTEAPVTSTSLYSPSIPVTAEQQQPFALPVQSHQDGLPSVGHQQVDRWREPELETSRSPHADRSRLMSVATTSIRGIDQPRREPSTTMRRVTWNGERVEDQKEFPTQRININGRVEEEERNWWDPDARKTYNRPGPGMLPSLVENYLHEPDHTLFSVSASPLESGRQSKRAFHTNSPSASEVRRSIPHPNAYYCPKHNGWVLLHREHSAWSPPLSKHYDGPPLPNITRRSRVHSCLVAQPLSAPRPNETHHFHYYKAAMDGSKIARPFNRADWENLSRTEPRQQGTDPINHSSLDTPHHDSNYPREAEDNLLDLFICCQCTVYIVVSDIIPGVIPCEAFEAFVREKLHHPQAGKTPAMSLITAIDTVLT